MREIWGFPAYEEYPHRVSAEVFNLWRRVWRKIQRPMNFDLEGIPPMAMELEEQLWVCVDVSFNKSPVIAWSDFQNKDRALHDPVPCIVTQFHFGASQIREQALLVMAEELHRMIGD